MEHGSGSIYDHLYIHTIPRFISNPRPGQSSPQDISMENTIKKCQALRSINCLLIVYSHQESDKIEGFNKTLEAP